MVHANGLLENGVTNIICVSMRFHKKCDKIFLKPELSALIGLVITRRVMKQTKWKNRLVVS